MTWYVASLARYVLVEADTPEDARTRGEITLGMPALTVRPATEEEIELARFHERMTREWQ
jgi:hypothetical protein